ncbi:MAG TPA: N-6 DNA methylase [Chitinophaga sp.]|uniref:N-6 DNA methylase n=1 Tax=Chitinophaga sp. TaxID=1869181 RepID=UPI002C2D164D|nr:N-6 DNA methylase [Chitinophaga sp.]HVI44594.1 N-6 DNA methylase [Chitinophaga sp.]
MRYNHYGIEIPQQQRAMINLKIAGLIGSGDLRGITAEEIYNLYSGKGGLSGKQRKDYDNYYQYGEAKRDFEQGQFYTPHDLCRQIVAALQPEDHFRVADLACGTGNFFNHLPKSCIVYGNELDPIAASVCRLLYPDAHIQTGDFMNYDPGIRFDLVLGNPPFNLYNALGSSQLGYIHQSEKLLKLGGLLVVIVPLKFLGDTFADGRQIRWLDEHFHFVGQFPLPADSFDAVIETKLLVLQKKGLPKAYTPYNPDLLLPFEPPIIHQNLVRPIYQTNRREAPALHLQAVQSGITDTDTRYRIEKCLYHIKANPPLRKMYYERALARILKLSDPRPLDMDYETWVLHRAKPEEVLGWLKKILSRQNDPAPKKIIKLVKTNYGLRYKAYHRELRSQEWSESVHKLLDQEGKDLRQFRRLYACKRKTRQLQDTPFDQLSRNQEVDCFLDNFTLQAVPRPGELFTDSNFPQIRLNGQQKKDLGLIFQKRYGLLSWQQGGGKSVAGMCWMRFIENRVQARFILAPALAIATTWTERLTAYGFSFIRISRISDCDRVQPGQIILVSFDMLTQLKRQVKALVKRYSYKIALLVDESDELTNANSKRSKATLSCFRKAKYKLLTTGTTTRNNINELYTQLELLYNNSSNFLCQAPLVYKTDKEGCLEPLPNEQLGFPFPAYHGNSLFRYCFSPQKTSVLGIKKENQDVFNAGHLATLLAKTVITRSLEQIVGEQKYEIKTHAVIQNEAERALYEMLMKDFCRIIYDYYTSTGNSRKDAALWIVRQIMSLIKATSMPHLMPNFRGYELPGKYQKIFSMLDGWPSELVTIGCTLKEAAQDYFSRLQQRLPERQLFYIDGEISIQRRIKVLESFKSSGNGILVCTQQSLKSSVNIPFCNKCIIESLQWNIPKISQFYFRFIRFDSPFPTQVHFVNYENTIELNLLALLMAKEKLNSFVKTLAEQDRADIYEAYDIDMGILDMLVQKEYDAEGRMSLSWGRQSVSR